MSTECARPAGSGWLAALRSRGGLSATLSLAIVLALLFVFSFAIGRYPVSPLDVIRVFVAQAISAVISIAGWLGTDVHSNAFLVWLADSSPVLPAMAATVVMEIRLPRIISAVLVGGSLAIAGASFQGLFRNPLVSPDILGVASGAGFGAALGILISGDPLVIQGLAFVFSLAAVGVSYAVSKMVRSNPTLSLILAGMAIGSLFGAFLSLVKYVADPTDQLPTIVYWLMGSLAAVDHDDLLMVAGPMIAGIIILLLIRWRLNVLAMGEEEALSMGVDTRKIRGIVIVCCTMITASAVCISGVIGWIGLVIPHMGRMLVGPCHKKLLPMATLMGGAFLLVIDNLTRTAASVEIPIGILTAIIGVPFFLYLLMNRKKGWL